MKNYFLLIHFILLMGCNRPGPVTDLKESNDTTGNKFSYKQNPEASLFSEITCPKCKHTKTEKLPTDVCLVSYTCENCKEILHPIDGDCCVFCTFGTHKCPSKQ